MKLLFDQNLSHKLPDKLADIYPDSTHVKVVNLATADDLEVWLFAKNNAYTITTQDSDFVDIGLLNGYPPKIIWLRCGNKSTKNIEQILRDNHEIIREFIEELPQSYLELF
ncbi:DUF5615 family PIN-like protein [Thermoflexibacter ruber]|jgi:predicted nuclease of predicted toxin-antitoxin system|uniref:Predicted nuclease, contains PIN domain, potential toxin-antitoxin system component n=1 Tax=Thermoflexibacter ruber TaxID=1003 RepID=A0A1I2K506_9BACT|nr:DUF5615 family PIN-like protein [Thermoflexibacter ruber]SFF61513.1 Predicted nuclease, contains PIN domain, potential toxin-antitoxin system component [Thermoflexibacter ruber]